MTLWNQSVSLQQQDPAIPSDVGTPRALGPTSGKGEKVFRSQIHWASPVHHFVHAMSFHVLRPGLFWDKPIPHFNISEMRVHLRINVYTLFFCRKFEFASKVEN